jgi:hypothetical protein
MKNKQDIPVFVPKRLRRSMSVTPGEAKPPGAGETRRAAPTCKVERLGVRKEGGGVSLPPVASLGVTNICPDGDKKNHYIVFISHDYIFLSEKFYFLKQENLRGILSAKKHVAGHRSSAPCAPSIIGYHLKKEPSIIQAEHHFKIMNLRYGTFYPPVFLIEREESFRLRENTPSKPSFERLTYALL